MIRFFNNNPLFTMAWWTSTDFPCLDLEVYWWLTWVGQYLLLEEFLIWAMERLHSWGLDGNRATLWKTHLENGNIKASQPHKMTCFTVGIWANRSRKWHFIPIQVSSGLNHVLANLVGGSLGCACSIAHNKSDSVGNTAFVHVLK